MSNRLLKMSTLVKFLLVTILMLPINLFSSDDKDGSTNNTSTNTSINNSSFDSSIAASCEKAGKPGSAEFNKCIRDAYAARRGDETSLCTSEMKEHKDSLKELNKACGEVFGAMNLQDCMRDAVMCNDLLANSNNVFMNNNGNVELSANAKKCPQIAQLSEFDKANQLKQLREEKEKALDNLLKAQEDMTEHAKTFTDKKIELLKAQADERKDASKENQDILKEENEASQNIRDKKLTIQDEADNLQSQYMNALNTYNSIAQNRAVMLANVIGINVCKTEAVAYKDQLMNALVNLISQIKKSDYSGALTNVRNERSKQVINAIAAAQAKINDKYNTCIQAEQNTKSANSQALEKNMMDKKVEMDGYLNKYQTVLNKLSNSAAEALEKQEQIKQQKLNNAQTKSDLQTLAQQSQNAINQNYANMMKNAQARMNLLNQSVQRVENEIAAINAMPTGDNSTKTTTKNIAALAAAVRLTAEDLGHCCDNHNGDAEIKATCDSVKQTLQEIEGASSAFKSSETDQ